MNNERNTIDIIDRFGSSVVAVNVEILGERLNPFGDQFNLPNQPELRQGSGSGFVIDERGRMITNFHMIQGALESNSVTLLENATISVSFPDGSVEAEVRVVGATPTTTWPCSNWSIQTRCQQVRYRCSSPTAAGYA